MTAAFDLTDLEQVEVLCGPQGTVFGKNTTAGAIPGCYLPPSRNPYDRLTDITADLGVDTNEGGVSAIAEYKLGSATITSVSAWRFWNWVAANDRDYTGLPIQLTQHIPSQRDQFSQELRIASPPTSMFESDWTA